MKLFLTTVLIGCHLFHADAMTRDADGDTHP
jgi:hypothetical protein